MLLVLPYWPRLYARLANDQDRRVREATQKAHLIGKQGLCGSSKSYIMQGQQSNLQGQRLLSLSTAMDDSLGSISCTYLLLT